MSDIIKSCLNYQGNKYKLMKERRIHEFLPKINHDNPYCELFCGSAVMFFNLPSNHMFAFLNDINEELQNFWYVIYKHFDQFLERLEYVYPGFMIPLENEIDRAVQFYVSNVNTNFITKPLKIDKKLIFWKKKLDDARLYIDCKPFDEEMDYLMKLHTSNNPDRPTRVIFYEDPPYWGSEDVYKSWRKDHTTEKSNKKGKFDHELLAEKNHEAREKGHFILLSYNDVSEIRDLYPGWYMKSYAYTPNGKGTRRAKERKELLISSHEFKRRGIRKMHEFF